MIIEKYSASGNDFLITHLPIQNRIQLVTLLCNRFEGIGADGMVFLSPHSPYAYQWDFYNSDGSKALMCGNASRCVGLYACLHSLAPLKHYFLSGAGEIGIEVQSIHYPYRVKSHLGAYKLLRQERQWFLIDTGVPHLITLLSQEEFETFPLEKMKQLREIYNANVNIAYEDQGIYHIKTYERGVEGITLACGTGMASLVAYLQENHLLSSSCIQIIPPIGEKLCFWIQNHHIAFEGEVKKIAQCNINLADFGVKL